MMISSHQNPSLGPVRRLARSLRARHTARAQRRALLRELHGYTTVSEIDDLLAVLAREETREAETMRSVLLSQRSSMFRAA